MDALANQISANLQKTVASVYANHANEPVEQVRDALHGALKSTGVQLPDALVSSMAEHISEGRPVDTSPK